MPEMHAIAPLEEWHAPAQLTHSSHALDADIRSLHKRQGQQSASQLRHARTAVQRDAQRLRHRGRRAGRCCDGMAVTCRGRASQPLACRLCAEAEVARIRVPGGTAHLAGQFVLPRQQAGGHVLNAPLRSHGADSVALRASKPQLRTMTMALQSRFAKHTIPGNGRPPGVCTHIWQVVRPQGQHQPSAASKPPRKEHGPPPSARWLRLHPAGCAQPGSAGSGGCPPPWRPATCTWAGRMPQSVRYVTRPHGTEQHAG